MEKIHFQITPIQKEANGEKMKVTIQIPTSEGWIDNVYLHFIKGKSIYLPFQRKENGYAIFENTFYLETKAIYSYYFSYKKEGIYCEVKDIDNTPYKLSVNFSVPDWAKGKIMYHIFVDRFARGEKKKEILPHRHLHNSIEEEPVLGPDKEGLWNTDYYGGDLRGIIQKLDYIKSLGVSILYLSPIVKSQSNHRYDTGDYLEIDPYVGCKEDLQELCKKAHQRGMKVILDAVFNHTGNDSLYYNEYGSYPSLGAYQSTESPYSSFYKKEGNNFQYWWGNKNLPVCNGEDPKWKEFITGKDGVIDQWFRLGIDGLRLDVADDLRDDFIEEIRKAVKRNKKDGFILGEVWENPMKMNRGYLESGKGLDSVMNYTMMDALIRYYRYADVEKLKKVMEEIVRDLPEESIQSFMNFTSTHDISRIMQIFGYQGFNPNTKWAWDVNNENHEYLKKQILSKEEYEKARELVKSYLFTLCFLPGNISIFYGDEAGIQGLGNLLNRKPYPWMKEDEDLIQFVKEIGRIRKQESFLEKAKTRIRYINPDYFCFERIGKEKKAIITINRTNKNGYIWVPPEYEESGIVYSHNNSKPNYLTPYGGVALIKK